MDSLDGRAVLLVASIRTIDVSVAHPLPVDACILAADIALELLNDGTLRRKSMCATYIGCACDVVDLSNRRAVEFIRVVGAVCIAVAPPRLVDELPIAASVKNGCASVFIYILSRIKPLQRLFWRHVLAGLSWNRRPKIVASLNLAPWPCEIRFVLLTAGVGWAGRGILLLWGRGNPREISRAAKFRGPKPR